MTENSQGGPESQFTPVFTGEMHSYSDDESIDPNQGIPEIGTQESEWSSWSESSEAGDDSLSAVIQRLRDLLGSAEMTGADDYQVFTTPESREELFAIGKGIAEYIKDYEIGTVCFVDRAARPAYVALNEYWNRAYKGDEKPDIRFINPKGFVSREDIRTGRVDLYNLMINDAMKQGDSEDPLNLRDEKDIIQDIVTYQEKSGNANKQTLIFDACIHTGESLYPVLDKMYRAGVEDIHIGTVSDFEITADLAIDLQIMKGEPDLCCYPFGHDRMTKKVYGSLVAEPTDDPLDREDAAIIRKEIKKAIDEQWELHESQP